MNISKAELVERLRCVAERPAELVGGLNDLLRQAADFIEQSISPPDVGEAMSDEAAELLGIVSKMHTAWMRRDELMQQQGGLELIERMANLLDEIVDDVPTLWKATGKALSTLPAPDHEVTIRDALEGVVPRTYAYKYRDGWRFGTHGREINGGKPERSEPLFALSDILASLNKDTGS